MGWVLQPWSYDDLDTSYVSAIWVGGGEYPDRYSVSGIFNYWDPTPVTDTTPGVTAVLTIRVRSTSYGPRPPNNDDPTWGHVFVRWQNVDSTDFVPPEFNDMPFGIALSGDWQTFTTPLTGLAWMSFTLQTFEILCPDGPFDVAEAYITITLSDVGAPPLRMTQRDDNFGKHPTPRIIGVTSKNASTSSQGNPQRVGVRNVWW